ncbi:hypothetical protein ALT721_510010 [Alteromonas alvinellae]
MPVFCFKSFFIPSVLLRFSIAIPCDNQPLNTFTPIVAKPRIGYGEKVNTGENNDKKPVHIREHKLQNKN